METIKFTTWNIEHFGRLLPDPPQNLESKMRGIIDEITSMDPDILCIIEGPGNLPHLQAWVQSPHGLGNRYHVATIPGTEEILQENPENPRQALQKLYAMQGNNLTGNQWIWFLVRDGLFQESGAHILDPRIWQDLTGQSDWPVHYWGKLDLSRHNHWRHPQTLIMKLKGVELEFIGGHLKSKINTLQPFDENGNLTENFVLNKPMQISMNRLFFQEKLKISFFFHSKLLLDVQVFSPNFLGCPSFRAQRSGDPESRMTEEAHGFPFSRE